MQVTNNTSTAANANFLGGGTGKATATAGNNDFETFLTLLTAQMRNQDPLKPMDSTEFVAQLATFSAVEQQVKTNDQLATLIDLYTASPAAGLAEWIGKEVRHYGATDYNANPINVYVQPDTSADTAFLLVRDADNQVVAHHQFNPTDNTVIWDGALDAITTANPGRYSFAVESYQGNTLLNTTQAAVFDLVTEVRRDNSGMSLVFTDGTTMAVEDATAVRLPS